MNNDLLAHRKDLATFRRDLVSIKVPGIETMSPEQLFALWVEDCKKGRREPDISTLKDAKALPPEDYLFRDLHVSRGRTTCICASSFSGKSLLTMHLAAALATGNKYLGAFDAGKSAKKIRILNWDAPRADALQPMPRIVAGFVHPDTPYRAPALALLEEQAQCKIEVITLDGSMYLTDHDARKTIGAFFADTDLVIVDAFRSAAKGADENSSEIRQYIDLLSMMAQEHNTTCINVAHTGKSESNGKFSIRGSSAIVDAHSTKFDLCNEGSQTYSIKFTKARGAAHLPQPIYYTMVDRGPERDIVFTHVADRNDGRILKLLETVYKLQIDGEKGSVSKIRDACSVDKTWISKELERWAGFAVPWIENTSSNSNKNYRLTTEGKAQLEKYREGE